MLKKAASGVLVTPWARCTAPYASPLSLPAALLDLASRRRAGLFEHPGQKRFEMVLPSLCGLLSPFQSKHFPKIVNNLFAYSRHIHGLA